MKIASAKILQIMAAPAPMADKEGNIYAGYALVELAIEYENETVLGRDIVPFGTDGGLMGLHDSNGYYHAHALGDFRPDFAHILNQDEINNAEVY